MTSRTDKTQERPTWKKEILVRNPRYAGAKTPGDVARALARFNRPVKNQAAKKG